MTQQAVCVRRPCDHCDTKYERCEQWKDDGAVACCPECCHPPTAVMEAAHLIAEGAADGAALADDIRQHEHEPWRWSYPTVYLSDDAAYACAREAACHVRAGLTLLGVEVPR